MLQVNEMPRLLRPEDRGVEVMNANESGDRPHTDDGGSDGTAPVDAWRRDTTGDAPVADLAGEMASGIGTSSADITSRATSAVAAYLAWRSRSGLPLGSPDDLNDVDLARYRRDARPSRRAIELLQRVQRSQSGGLSSLLCKKLVVVG